MPVPGAAVLFPGELTFMAGTELLHCRSEFATEPDEAIRSATFGASGLIHVAPAMGLGTTPMIGFDPVGVSREFSLSDNEVPALLVAVGYPTEANWPQKPRRPISDVLAFA